MHPAPEYHTPLSRSAQHWLPYSLMVVLDVEHAGAEGEHDHQTGKSSSASIFLRPAFIKRRHIVQRCKVLQQQTMDENVSTSHLTEQNALGGIIEETGI